MVTAKSEHILLVLKLRILYSVLKFDLNGLMNKIKIIVFSPFMIFYALTLLYLSSEFWLKTYWRLWNTVTSKDLD